jgi:hypothetical protein
MDRLRFGAKSHFCLIILRTGFLNQRVPARLSRKKRLTQSRNGAKNVRITQGETKRR